MHESLPPVLKAYAAIEEIRKRLTAGRTLESVLDAAEIERVSRAVGVTYRPPQQQASLSSSAASVAAAPTNRTKGSVAPTGTGTGAGFTSGADEDEVAGFAVNERVPDED